MFGYVRPIKDKLSPEEYESFRAVYCGLCHCMRRRLGMCSSFTVNYDFTFMALLLIDSGEGSEKCKSCIAHPFKKRRCLQSCAGLEAAADMGLILAYLKLEDDVRDESFFRSLRSRLAMLLLRRGYKTACRYRERFANNCKELLTQLSSLEDERCASLDMPADKFALILASASEGASEPVKRRILEHLFYHLGRIIYLLDALDDLPLDMESGSYNPVLARYGLSSSLLPDEASANLDLTLRHSMNLIASDFQLLPKTRYSDILMNTIYLGVPAIASGILKARLPQGKNTVIGDKE